MGGGTGGAVLVNVGTNNAEKEGTSAIVGKYRRLIKTLKEARVGQIVLSRILPIMGGRGEEYRNCRRMTINTQVQKVCMEEGVGFVNMWLNFVGRGDFFMRDGLHLTGKGAAVLSCEFVRVVDEGTGLFPYSTCLGANQSNTARLSAGRILSDGSIAYVCHNVQLICDADMLIINCVAKWPGSVHDARILWESPLFDAFESHQKPLTGVSWRQWLHASRVAAHTDIESTGSPGTSIHRRPLHHIEALSNDASVC
ncbi:hypothetical protein LSAT2_019508 [Lamellibrachia satsuma]|nr:hypothetical protein LSAT2_019508 [Lamellibrachia satsuma]